MSSVEKQLAAKTIAYDVLKIIFNKIVAFFMIVLIMMAWYLYQAKVALDLNTITLELNAQRFEEMRKAYDIQAIYYNNMKARIEALNEVKENE